MDFTSRIQVHSLSFAAILRSIAMPSVEDNFDDSDAESLVLFFLLLLLSGALLCRATRSMSDCGSDRSVARDPKSSRSDPGMQD